MLCLDVKGVVMFIKLQAKDQSDKDVELDINTRQVSFIVDGKYVHMAGGGAFELPAESMKKLLLEIQPKGKKKDNSPDSGLLALFEELHTLTGGKGKVVFSLKREKQLKDLLGKHRLTEDNLRKAARNIGADEFLQGDNDRNKRYGDVDYLLRPDKAAKWAEEQAKKEKGMFG